MSALTQFFLGSSPAVIQYDLLEIYSPYFNNIYRIVRNGPPAGIDVLHEGGLGPFHYDYYPAKITPVASGSDLTQALSVTLGDLGSIIQTEVAAVTARNGMNTRPVAAFRVYRSDVLSAPMFGPLNLEISQITTSKEGNSFDCHAPKLNSSRTGVLYTIDQFPMLRGFL